jgi:protein TIF31
LFGTNLETYINSILSTEPYFLTQSPLPVNFWISSENQFKNKNSQNSKETDTNSTLIPLYGLDPKGIRDWNEEF